MLNCLLFLLYVWTTWSIFLLQNSLNQVVSFMILVLLWSPAVMRREKGPRKGKWEIFWDYLGRFFSKVFCSFLPITTSFAHISTLQMALSVRIFVKPLDSAVRGSWDQHSQTALWSYPGIKIHPQRSILIWFGLVFCIFMKTITITITALGRSLGGFWLIEIRQKEVSLSGNWCLYFSLKKKFHKSWIQ